jgi:uncharacterized delta-60 repeat protein
MLLCGLAACGSGGGENGGGGAGGTAGTGGSAGGGGGAGSEAIGSLDTSFGADGVVVHDDAAGGSGSDSGFAIAIDAAGQILVAGHSDNARGDTDMVIWRYNTDGSLDASFGADGVVVHDDAAGGSGYDGGSAISIDAAGQILVAGHSDNARGDTDMVIWRYNTDGSLDTSFGADGVVVHDDAAGGSGYDRGSAISIDAAGQILVAGYSNNASDNSDMVIWRYNTDGSLDTSFGADGIVVHDDAAGGSDDDRGSAISIDAAGQILVAGYSNNASGNSDMVIWRYNADGSLDTGFGADGIVVHDDAAGGRDDDRGSAISIDAAGRILVTGYSNNASANWDMVIWRYNADGSLDTSFGADGIVVHNNAAGGNAYDSGSAIAIGAAGKILVAGYSENDVRIDEDMVIWRYNTDGSLDTSFGADGIVVHNNAAGGGDDDRGSAIITDAAGRILVGGRSDNARGDRDMVVWRYE